MRITTATHPYIFSAISRLYPMYEAPRYYADEKLAPITALTTPTSPEDLAATEEFLAALFVGDSAALTEFLSADDGHYDEGTPAARAWRALDDMLRE